MARTRKRNGNPRVAVAYLRCSTDRQEESPRVQRAAIAQWAESHGVRVVAEQADVGVSGATEGDSRAGLVAALAAVEEHGAGLLLVQRRDRLARDTAEAAIIGRTVGRLGARVVAVDVGDADGLGGLVISRTLDLVAEIERRLISERTRLALASKRARGERMGQVPYGYRVAADGVHLVEREDEQEAVRLVRSSRAAGMTYRAIGERLEAAGHVPRGGGRWHPQTVANIARATAVAA